MRAALFYRTLNHGRKIYNRERNLLLRDLCEVGVIPHHFQNYKASREYFTERAFPKVNRALPADDKKSAEIVAAMFRAVANSPRLN